MRKYFFPFSNDNDVYTFICKTSIRVLPKKLNRRYDYKIGKLNSAKIEGAEVKTRKAQLGLNHDLNEIIK